MAMTEHPEALAPPRRVTARNAKPPEDRHFVTALARGLDVLACFRSRDSVLSNQELAQRCGLAKSTVSRLTLTLTRQGYLAQDRETGKFRLGHATLALGGAALAGADLAQTARPLMQQLADESGGMVALGIPNSTSMIYVEVCRSAVTLSSALAVGSRLPMVTSAMGRAYLAALDDGERTALLQRVQCRRPDTWPAALAAASRAVCDFRALGCATSFGDWHRGVNAIAVPVLMRGRGPVAAINCGGPVSEMSQGYLMTAVRPRMLSLVHRLHALLR